MKTPAEPAAPESFSVPVRNDLVILPRAGSSPMDKSFEMRRIRKHFVLNLIREQPGLSRAEIAKQAGLNLPSVSALVDELVSDELVKEQDARPSLRGRPPIPILLREDAASVLGIDIGKKTTTMFLANLKGQPLVSFERPTPTLFSPEAYTEWTLEVADEILGQSASYMPPLCGIGVAVPGLVTSVASNVAAGPGAVGAGESWLAVESVRKALADKYRVEVLVDNDARLCVTGATWFSTGRRKYKNLAVLNLGFGLGLGVMVNGHLLRGEKGFAGEIGHIPLGRPGAPCYCGRSGCLETIASGAAITALAKERGLPVTDVEELAKRARQGFEDATAVFDVYADGIGRAAASIINLFNPEAIILTGKVSRAADVFLDSMKASMAAHSLPAAVMDTEIIVEPAKNLSILGAVAVVLNQVFFSSHISVEEIL